MVLPPVLLVTQSHNLVKVVPPRSHRASEMLVLSPQQLGAKSNVYFGHSRELINFIITDNYFSYFFESSSWPRPKPTRLKIK